MKRFSIGRAITDGFELVGRKPLAVFVWGVLLAVPYALMAPLYVSMADAIPWGSTDSEAASEMIFGEMMRFQALSNLVSVIQLVLGVIVSAAVLRAMLWPNRARAFYLRAGLHEVRLAVVWIGSFIGLFIIVLILGLILIVLGVAASQPGHGAAAAMPAMIIIVMAPAMILGLAMISLMPAATMDTADFGFVAGWKAAWASWGRLCGLLVALLLILIVVQLLVMAVMAGILAIAWSIGLLGDVGAAFKDPQSWAIDGGKVAGLVALFFVPVAVVSGVLQVLMIAPFASAWRQIRASAPIERAPEVVAS